MVPELNKCFSENSLELFNINPNVAIKLRHRVQARAILQLLPTLRHLSKVHGGNLITRLKSESFREALFELRAPNDNLTEIVLGLLAPGFQIKKRSMSFALQVVKRKIKNILK
jgi:hypothetical protein